MTTASINMPYRPEPTPPGAISPSIMLSIATPPPGAVNESCIELTAPVDVPVVDAPNSADAAAPNRTSLPSSAPPAAAGADPGPAISAQVSRATETPRSRAITASTAPPWRRSRTMRPKAHAIAKGITSIRKTAKRLVNGVGFSNGWAELTL